MTTDQETLRVVRSWLEDGRTRLPEHVLDAVLDQVPATPQRRPDRSPRRMIEMDPRTRYVTVAAAVVVVAVVSLNLLGMPRQDAATVATSPSVSPSPSASASPSPSATLPRLGLPRTLPSSAGEYGWEGGPAQRSMTHQVVGDGEDLREMALIFEVGDACLERIKERQPQPVHIAGFDGVSVEPYEPPVTFGGYDGGEITRAHALSVGDRTLCLYLTWRPTTTDDDLAAAARILDSLRAEPIGEDRIRIVFTLDEGWDTG